MDLKYCYEKFNDSKFYKNEGSGEFISLSLFFDGDNTNDTVAFCKSMYDTFLKGIFLEDNMTYHPHYGVDSTFLGIELLLDYLSYNNDNTQKVGQVVEKIFNQYDNCYFSSIFDDGVQFNLSNPKYDFLPAHCKFLVYSTNY